MVEARRDRRRGGLIAALVTSLLCLLGAAGVLGCRPGDDTSTVVLHLADDAAASRFIEDARLFSENQVFRWPLTPAEADPWTLDGRSSKADLNAHGWWVHEPELVILSRELPPEATRIHTLEVALRGMHGQVRACWSSGDEGFTSSRCVASRTKGVSSQTVTLRLADNPSWTGHHDRLRLELIPFRPTALLVVSEVLGVRLEPRAEELSAALRESWLVTFDDDVYRDTRVALLAPPGVDIERRLVVPADARLRVGYGVPTGVRTPVRFTVGVEAVDGGATPARASWDVSPEGSAVGVWHSAEVDLRAFEGREVVVTLATEADPGFDLARGLPVWAGPEAIGAVARPRRPNVLLISLDTFRADHMSLYGYARETTPSIDAWAQRCGTTFESAVASAPWTIPSHISMLTGVDAIRHGVNHAAPAPPSLTTLAERLRGEGYGTAAITGGGYLSQSYGLTQGFDHYRAWRQLTRSAMEPEVGVDTAIAWLEERRDEPFFLFFHTYGAHTPYHSRQPYLSRFRELPVDFQPRWIGTQLVQPTAEQGYQMSLRWIWLDDPTKKREGSPVPEDDLAWVIDLYDSGIAHLDHQVGRLVDALDRLGLDDDTLVVLTSDHGEHLGEKGEIGHLTLYDENLLVPLVVALPGCASGGRRVAAQVRSVDIAPTVLDLVSAPPLEAADGGSLVSMLSGRTTEAPSREAWSYAAESNRGVSVRYGNRIKYTFNDSAFPVPGGRDRVYDLVADPRERNDVSAGFADLDELRSRVRSRLADSAQGLRLTFRNDERAPMTGRLGVRLGDKSWSRVKTWNAPAGALERQGEKIAFRVEPGEEWTVLLNVPPGEATLTLDVAYADAGPPPLSESVTLKVGDVWHAVSRDGAWDVERDASVAGPWSGLLVQRTGSASAQAEPAVDEELAEQLRALGYVD